MKEEKRYNTGIGHAKFFFVGGYSVLDRKNVGLVLSLEPIIKCEGILEHFDLLDNIVEIQALTHPKNIMFKYSFDKRVDIKQSEPPLLTNGYDCFIHASIYTFFYHFSFNSLDFGEGNNLIKLEITGDSSFYNNDGKNGLGSSAATTVSIISCLMKIFSIKNDDLLFKLAAIAHSLAQGKIGSCFDISCAIFGSQIYRRPSPSFISLDKLNEKWDYEIEPIKPRLQLIIYLLYTEFKGSSTPKLVKIFNEAAKTHQSQYQEYVDTTQNTINILKNSNNIEEIKQSLKKLRHIQRQISKDWNCPIVPDEIEKKAIELEQNEDIIGVVVPGAGGYDSIAVVTKNPHFIPNTMTIISKTYF